MSGQLLLLSYLLIALCCAILAAGWTVAYFTAEFPLARESKRDEWGTACAFGFITFCIPPVIIAVFFLSAFAKHGWGYK